MQPRHASPSWSETGHLRLLCSSCHQTIRCSGDNTEPLPSLGTCPPSQKRFLRSPPLVALGSLTRTRPWFPSRAPTLGSSQSLTYLDLLMQVQLHLVHQLPLLELNAPSLLDPATGLCGLRLSRPAEFILLLPPLLNHHLTNLRTRRHSLENHTLRYSVCRIVIMHLADPKRITVINVPLSTITCSSCLSEVSW